MPTKVPKERVRADIRRVANELEKEPTKREYDEYGNWTSGAAVSHFGSWTEAKKACGVWDGGPANRRVSEEEFLDDLQRVLERIDGDITREKYREHGQYSPSVADRRFGGILAALKELGAEHRMGYAPNDVSDEEYLQDIYEVAVEIGHPPSKMEYEEHGRFSYQTAFDRFGGWVRARKLAGLNGGPMQNQRIHKHELVDAIIEVYEELGHVPSQIEFSEHSDYSYQPVVERFGSYNAGVRAANLEPNDNNPFPWEDAGYRYSAAEWRAKREEALERDDRTCVVCGMTDAEHQDEYGTGIHVHHIERIGDNEGRALDLSNLVTLCVKHHREYETASAKKVRELKEKI